MLIQNNRFQNFSYCLRFGVVLLATSVVAGLGGILLHEFLEMVEKVVLGHGEEIKVLAISQKQFLMIVIAGVVSALIWYVLQRKNRRLISVKSQMKADNPCSERPALGIHLMNIFLQVASVGAGSPIGKEGAPRELGALGAGRISDYMHLNLPDRRLAIACGASAGLSAVYQVPIASIFFAFETLGVGLSLMNVMAVSLTSIFASLIAGLVISDAPLYHGGQISLNLATCLLAVLVAVLITPLAEVFRRLTQKAQVGKETHEAILWKLPLTFLLLASVALYFPEILGNGGALTQAVFDGMTLSYAIPILIIKVCLVLLTLKKWRIRRYLNTIVFNGGSFRISICCALSVSFSRYFDELSHVNWVKCLLGHYYECTADSGRLSCLIYRTKASSPASLINRSSGSCLYK